MSRNDRHAAIDAWNRVRWEILKAWRVEAGRDRLFDDCVPGLAEIERHLEDLSEVTP